MAFKCHHNYCKIILKCFWESVGDNDNDNDNDIDQIRIPIFELEAFWAFNLMDSDSEMSTFNPKYVQI